jgi:hypothetical protein
MSDLRSELALEADRGLRSERRVLWALAGLGLLVLLF